MMARQGSCLDPTPDALTVLDRLAGLSKVISPAVMEQALLDTGRAGQRACTLSHRVMLWVVLAMGVLTDLPIRQVFKHAAYATGRQNARAAICARRDTAWGWSRSNASLTSWSNRWPRRRRQALLSRPALDGHRRHRPGCA